MTANTAEPTLKQSVVTRVKEPGMFKVIFLNDNVTHFDFVISSLVTIFDYALEDAHHTATVVHEQGSAVVAILPFEMAEQKVAETLLYAKANSFPLLAIFEPLE